MTSNAHIYELTNYGHFILPALQHVALADDGRLYDLVVANGIPPAFVPKIDDTTDDGSSSLKPTSAPPSSSGTFKTLTKIITGELDKSFGSTIIPFTFRML